MNGLKRLTKAVYMTATIVLVFFLTGAFFRENISTFPAAGAWFEKADAHYWQETAVIFGYAFSGISILYTSRKERAMKKRSAINDGGI